MPELPEEAEYVVSEIIAAFSSRPSPFTAPPDQIDDIWKLRIASLEACFYSKSDYDAFFSNISETEYLDNLTPWGDELLILDVPGVSYIMPRLMCACLRHPERWQIYTDPLLLALHYRRHDARLYAIIQQFPAASNQHVQPRRSHQEWLENLTEQHLTPAEMNAINDWLILARDLFPIDEDEIDALMHQQITP